MCRPERPACSSASPRSSASCSPCTFLGEPAPPRVIAGSLTALAGCALIALSGGHTGYSGAALVVLAAACVQGLYHCAAKPLLRRYTAVEVACYAMWSGTLLLGPLAGRSVDRALTASASADLSVVFLGLLPSALGFVTWGYAVSRSTVSAATSVLYLVPGFALVVSFFWLREVPTLVDIAGGAIAIGGVVLIRTRRYSRYSRYSRSASREKKPPTTGRAWKPT